MEFCVFICNVTCGKCSFAFLKGAVFKAVLTMSRNSVA